MKIGSIRDDSNAEFKSDLPFHVRGVRFVFLQASELRLHKLVVRSQLLLAASTGRTSYRTRVVNTEKEK